MWLVVSVLNPMMAFFALTMIPIPEVKQLYSNTLLSHMAELSAGEWLAFIISIDAVLVLSGAVLTSFVGVSGLLERMTLDRILPPYFLKKNKKGSSYRIIIGFLLLSISILLITRGKVSILAGVYTISFLSVMALFVTGNFYLKIKRQRLPRPERASWTSLILAITAVTIAIIGNIVMKPEDGNPSNFSVFLEYFIPTLLFIIIMLNRTVLLRVIINVIHHIADPILKYVQKVNDRIENSIDRINSQEFVFFTKGDNIANLNRAMLYVLRNEQKRKMKIVTVIHDDSECPANLKNDIEYLDRAYPEIDIEFVKIYGTFSPSFIQELSKKWNILPNFMFIGSPSNKFPYNINELGGVRLII